MKTLALVCLLVSPGTGRAAPGDGSDPLLLFAACAGRYSAEMEHRWLIGTDAAEVTRTRATLIDLIDATISPGRGPEVLARRIEAKMAQASLLQRATFNRDAQDAARARRLAATALGHCRALMPGW